MTMAVIGIGVAAVGIGVGVMGQRNATANANAKIKGDTDVSMASAEASNKLRLAQTGATAAKNNLERWVQSVNNNRALDSGGKSLEQHVVNYRRQADAEQVASFSDNVRNMEERGARAAQAAVLGQAGSTVDMVNTSVALRDSIVRQQVENRTNMQASDAQMRAGNIVSQMVSGMDNSIILDSFDGNVSVGREGAPINPMEGTLGAVLQGLPLLSKSVGAYMGGQQPVQVQQPAQLQTFGFGQDNPAFRIGDTSTVDMTMGTGLSSSFYSR